MRSCAPTISAFAIASYLAAAFLPCEAPVDFDVVRAGSHAMDSMVSSSPAAESSSSVMASSPQHGMHHEMAKASVEGTASVPGAPLTTHHHHAAGSGHAELAAQSEETDEHHLGTHGRSGLHSRSDPDERRGSIHAGMHGEAEAGPRSQTSLHAKCLCGCSETRSWIGGGAARLGSVVPGSVIARLPEAAVIVPADRVRMRFVEAGLEHDPIPI